MTNYFKQAIQEDIKQAYLRAIKLYESSISENEDYVDSFTNLSFLYWQISIDFSFRDTYGIDDSLIVESSNRHMSILKKGIQIYPNDVELRFWMLYFPHRMFFDPLATEDVTILLKNYNSGNLLLPYFFLYLTDKRKYNKERDQLLSLCINEPTAKFNYIRSLIDHR